MKKAIFILSFTGVILAVIFNYSTIRDLFLFQSVKSVQIESKNDIIEFGQKIKCLNENIYSIDSNSINQVYNTNFPQIKVYNNSGEYVYTIGCYANIPNVLEQLVEHPDLKKQKDDDLNHEVSKLSVLSGKPIKQTSNKNLYTLVYYWSIWQGDLGKYKMNALFEKVKELKSKYEIEILYVNVDFQNGWESKYQQLKKTNANTK